MAIPPYPPPRRHRALATAVGLCGWLLLSACGSPDSTSQDGPNSEFDAGRARDTASSADAEDTTAPGADAASSDVAIEDAGREEDPDGRDAPNDDADAGLAGGSLDIGVDSDAEGDAGADSGVDAGGETVEDGDAGADADADAGADADADAGLDTVADSGTDAVADADGGATDAATEDVDAVDFPYETDRGGTYVLGGDGALRILILASSDSSPGLVASVLERLVVATGRVDSATVEASTVPTGRLLNLVYGWTDRESRLAVLDGDWDLVVFSDSRWVLPAAPATFFEATRAMAELVRSHGAVPAVLLRTPGTPPPGEDGTLCQNSCSVGSTATCEDDGPDALSGYCAYGTDCGDCGPRAAVVPPHVDVEPAFWRAAVGSGSVAVPAGITYSELGISSAEFPALAAASIFTALTGSSAAGLDAGAAGVDADRFDALADAAYERWLRDGGVAHYDGPYEGSVRLGDAPIPDVYRYATAGTSSEAGWSGAMRDLLTRQGISHTSLSLGSCSPTKSVTLECVMAVAPLRDAYVSLYARSYSLDGDEVRDAWALPTLATQIYDRHWDSTTSDGIPALDDILDRGIRHDARALRANLSWLPFHIMYARYKLEHPTASMLSDGVHATSDVQLGLAAMSFVSSTGQSPRTDGLGDRAASAMRIGEDVIRQLSTFSQTGAHLPDVPGNRVTVALERGGDPPP